MKLVLLVWVKPLLAIAPCNSACLPQNRDANDTPGRARAPNQHSCLHTHQAAARGGRNRVPHGPRRWFAWLRGRAWRGHSGPVLGKRTLPATPGQGTYTGALKGRTPAFGEPGKMGQGAPFILRCSSYVEHLWAAECPVLDLHHLSPSCDDPVTQMPPWRPRKGRELAGKRWAGLVSLIAGCLALSELGMKLLVIHSSHRLNVQTIPSTCPLYPRQEGVADAATNCKSYVLCVVAYLGKTSVRVCLPRRIYFIWLGQVCVFKEQIPSSCCE